MFKIWAITIALMLSMVADASVVVVCPDGCDYSKIQEAIDAASSGDIILVQSGTYHENLNVSKQIILLGLDIGLGVPQINAEDEGSAITLSSNGIVLCGFDVTNSSGNSQHSGIRIASSNNYIIANNVRNNKGFGINIGPSSNNNTVEFNNIEHNLKDGIRLSNSAYNRLIKNEITNQNSSIYMRNCSNNAFISNSINDSWIGFTFSQVNEENLMRNNRLSRTQNSFLFEGLGLNSNGANDIDTSNLINGKPIYYFERASDIVINSSYKPGIVICVSCKNFVIRDTIIENDQYGVYFLNTSNSQIINNTLAENNVGLSLSYSNNNTIKGNKAMNCSDSGMRLFESKDNFILENNISRCKYGLLLLRSGNNTLRNNTISRNYHNFDADWHNNIDTSNFVDGRSIYYLEGISDIVINSSSNAGVVSCNDCENITLRDLDLANNAFGIRFNSVSNSTIENNTIRFCEDGIILINSSNASIKGNLVEDCENFGISFMNNCNNIHIIKNIANKNFRGIFIEGSYHNDIEGNNLSYNIQGIGLVMSVSNSIKNNSISHNQEEGIYIEGIGTTSSPIMIQSSNLVEGNNIANNAYGIKAPSGFYNYTIYNNILKDNLEHDAFDEGLNQWDNGVTGNFYSEFKCVDDNGNGICDSGYKIPGGSGLDRYPLSKEGKKNAV